MSDAGLDQSSENVSRQKLSFSVLCKQYHGKVFAMVEGGEIAWVSLLC